MFVYTVYGAPDSRGGQQSLRVERVSPAERVAAVAGASAARRSAVYGYSYVQAMGRSRAVERVRRENPARKFREEKPAERRAQTDNAPKLERYPLHITNLAGPLLAWRKTEPQDDPAYIRRYWEALTARRRDFDG